MLKIVHKSWFMFFRRVYLSYNIILALLLICLQGISFGIGFFHRFRYVAQRAAESSDDADTYFDVGIMFTQIAVAARLLVVALLFSMIMGKAVALQKMIWMPEQFMLLADKIAHFFAIKNRQTSLFRFVSLGMQLILFIGLEFVPVLTGIIYGLVTLDIKNAFQIWLSVGVLCTMILIFSWFVCSIVESYVRIVKFLILRRRFVDGFQRLSNPTTPASRSTKEKSTIPQPVEKSSVNHAVTPSDVNWQVVDTDDAEMTPTEADQMRELTDIHKLEEREETNLFVLIYYFCCLASVFRPIEKYMEDKKGIKVKKLKQDDIPPSLRDLVLSLFFSVKTRSLWICIGVVLMLIIVSAIGFFRLWRLFLVVVVVAMGILANISLDRFAFIPRHKPSKKRLLAIWDNPNSNILDKYVGMVEEVMYHSPKIVWRACKFLAFLLSFLISLCFIFEFFHTVIVFTIPLVFIVFLMAVYFLRFNLVPCIYNLKTLGRKRGLATIPNVAESQRLVEQTSSSAIFSSKPEDDADNPYFRRQPASEGQTYGTEEEGQATESTDGTEAKPTKNPFCKYEYRPFRICSVFTLSFMLLTACLFVIITTIATAGFLSGLVIFLLLASMCFIVFMRYDHEIASTMIGFFVLFTLLLGSVFFLGNLQLGAQDDARNAAVVGHYVNRTEGKLSYSICREQWEEFSIIDYAFFSKLAYTPEPYFSKDLSTWFPSLIEEGAHVIYRENRSVSFYDLYLPKRNLSIIGVRGTQNTVDMVQDLDIWKEAALLQTASLFGPFVQSWPQLMTQSLIWLSNRVEQFSTANPVDVVAQRYYYAILDEYIATIRPLRHRVVITGHSLGGGLSKIAASRHRVKAVTFSGPGLVLSAMKLGISTEDINRSAVSVRPMGDLVPRFDVDGGQLQFIDCNDDFLKCHSLVRTTQNLIQSCGSDPRGRWIE